MNNRHWVVLAALVFCSITHAAELAMPVAAPSAPAVMDSSALEAATVAEPAASSEAVAEHVEILAIVGNEFSRLCERSDGRRPFLLPRVQHAQFDPHIGIARLDFFGEPQSGGLVVLADTVIRFAEAIR